MVFKVSVIIFIFFAYLKVSLLFAADKPEIYRWKDKDGVVNFSDDMPTDFGLRNDIDKIKYGNDYSQTTESLQQSEKESDLADKNGRYNAEYNQTLVDEEKKTEKIVSVPLVRSDSSYHLDVLVNGSYNKSFLLDTGASLTIISSKMAKELGYSDFESMPKMPISTAGGISHIYLIAFPSIEIGDMKLDNIEGGISTSLPSKVGGLLGASVLNNFTYQIDSANNVLSISDILSSKKKYGGKGESYWRKKFADLSSKVRYFREIERARKGSALAPQGYDLYQDYEDKDIYKIISFYEGLFAKLDQQATRMNVPSRWRIYP